MRAFLLATAPTVFCQPTRACSCAIQREMGSLRLGAPSAELAGAYARREVLISANTRGGVCGERRRELSRCFPALRRTLSTETASLLGGNCPLRRPVGARCRSPRPVRWQSYWRRPATASESGCVDPHRPSARCGESTRRCAHRACAPAQRAAHRRVCPAGQILQLRSCFATHGSVLSVPRAPCDEMLL